MRSVGKTHLGLVRKNNQDNYLNQKNKNGFCIFAVADGLGGHNAGEVASDYAVEELAGYFNIWEECDFVKDAQEIEEYIKNINKEIYNMSLRSEKLSGMGTTLTLVVTNGTDMLLFHVGDSRAYLISDKITQITKDHSLVQYLIDQGQITVEEGLHHPQKNIITRALGTDEHVEVDVLKLELKPLDKILICSDGLTNNVIDEKIFEIIKNNTIDNAAELLIDEANRNGGNDNITVVLYEG